METFLFEEAVRAIANGEYSNEDIKNVKKYLKDLNKKELEIRLRMDELSSNYTKSKNKCKNELKNIHNNIKQVKNILKNIN